MKNVVVCCDGTWNTPTEMDHGLPSPTNVVKLYNALEQNDAQLAYYHPGVGTGKSWWDHIAGGSTGEGLDQNIMSAYRWLGAHYEAGDKIFLFGFSRGAYTVRSLGGLIMHCGLIDLSAIHDNPTEVWKRVGEMFASYRNQKEFTNPNGCTFHNVQAGQPTKETTPIHFIGVWDTVGALGVPDDMALLGLLDSADKYRFHDTTLNAKIAHARHAVAIDEQRESFAPTLWSTVDARTDLKQIWFPGVHCDVGGGYVETGLSDRTLEWMLEEAIACDLKLRDTLDNLKKQLAPNPIGVVHDSCTGVFKALKTRPRPVPAIPAGAAVLDESTLERNAEPPLLQGDYWRQRGLPPGQKVTVDIYAIERWNRTGFYLEANRAYRFEASGQWVDHTERFDPAGGKATGFQLSDLVHSALSGLGEAENLFNKVTHRKADFWGTKRYEVALWFALVGFVASEFGGDDKKLASGETFLIGTGKTFTPKFGGYLYCYANDAWMAYGNNRGHVALTVTRA